MRKIHILLSALLLASMLLTACEGQATGTPVGTEEPSITEEPSMTPEVTSTSETPSGTQTDATQENATPAIPVTGGENPARVSNQLEFSVWNQDGEQIGDVNDLILDFDNLTVSYVVVGSGGVLGLGEKTVLVPWDFIQLQTEAGDLTGGEQYTFILQADQETFNNAPDTDLEATLPEMGEPAGDWDSEILNYWNNGVLPETPSADETTTPDAAESTATPGLDLTATPEDGTTSTAGSLQGVALASDVLAASIRLGTSDMSVDQSQSTPESTPAADATAVPDTDQNAQDLNIGIDDIIDDIDTGEIKYIVILANIDDGQFIIPVPIDLLLWDSSNEEFVVNADVTVLQNAPYFQNGEYPVTTVDGWETEFIEFWQNQ
jgi:sporulation protein YlmC with PRC-barrel domain